ncbi:porin [Candidatus Pelagibacter sp. HIMB1509]|uniref:porin n=1 Tax=Candidatus Pelagibacter sp. HIMB1509 TaxID=3413339 RepID=UPI003F8382F5
MNIKKIGLTALAGSLVATSAFAGSLEATGSAGINFAGADKGTSGNGWSMTDSVTFSGGGEMDNGMNVTVSFELDNNASAASGQFMDSRSIVIDTNGMGTVTFGGHGGSSAMGAVDDVMPTAYGEAWDILSNSPDNGSVTATASTNFDSIGSAGSDNMFHYSNSDLMDGLKLSLSYVPQGSTEASSSTDVAVEYTGIEGLTLGYAQGEDNATAGSETDNSTMYVKYAYGPITVGMQESEIDAATAANSDEFSASGITYQVNDDLTIGYHASAYNAGDKGVDQESTNISFSYTMGSMTLAAAFVDEENRGGETTAVNDISGYAIDLAFAF